jgi:hypothetical protein
LTTSRGSDALADSTAKLITTSSKTPTSLNWQAPTSDDTIGVNRLGNVDRPATTARTDSHSAHRPSPQHVATQQQRPSGRHRVQIGASACMLPALWAGLVADSDEHVLAALVGQRAAIKLAVERLEFQAGDVE